MRGAIAMACALALGGCTRKLLLMEPLPATYAWQRGDGERSEAATEANAKAASGPSAETATTAAKPPAAAATDAGLAAGIVLSRLPAPHLAPPTRTPVETPRTIDAARRLVGARDPRTALAFALAVADGLTDARPLPDLADGPALVAWAARHDALTEVEPGAAAPLAVAAGDLLVFDRAVGGAPASLVAVVLGRDPRGVVEILYLGGGVVRRGLVDPTRPKTARDRDGRVVNTFLRHNRDQPPDKTRFLAGALVAARVHLPR